MKNGYLVSCEETGAAVAVVLDLAGISGQDLLNDRSELGGIAQLAQAFALDDCGGITSMLGHFGQDVTGRTAREGSGLDQGNERDQLLAAERQIGKRAAFCLARQIVNDPVGKRLSAVFGLQCGLRRPNGKT